MSYAEPAPLFSSELSLCHSLSGKMGSRAALPFFSDVSLLLSRVVVCGCPVAYSRQAFSEHEDWALLNGQKEKK